MTSLVWSLAGYLAGSIPFALLLTRRRRGVDIRREGSGNIGAANVLRTAGVSTGLLVLALDVAKGAAIVEAAQKLTRDSLTPTLVGLAAIIGHVHPVWLRFRGGKGVATAGGVFAVLAPLAALISAALFVATVWITRYVSVGSIVASVALGPVAYFTHAGTIPVVGAVLACALILQRHRANVARLQAGTERRLGQRI
jgi:glycerol-3-phosphate acyltransferase PlsY